MQSPAFSPDPPTELLLPSRQCNILVSFASLLNPILFLSPFRPVKSFSTILLIQHHSIPIDLEICYCCSHAFRETNSLRRTMQIVEWGLLHRQAQGRVSSQPRTLTSFCKNVIYSKPTCPNLPPQIPWNQSEQRKKKNTIKVNPWFICLKPRQLTVDNYQQICGHTPISIIECMILFGYTDNQAILLGDGEPWGFSFWGPGFPVDMSFAQILGTQLRVHSRAQDGVLLSSQSPFYLFPPSFPTLDALNSQYKCHS